jgi:arylsulfatase A-like enzyme
MSTLSDNKIRQTVDIVRTALLTATMLLGAGVGTAQALNETPNVVFILADDIGWGDLGAYHELQTGTPPAVPTPTLDRLAREGMLFTDAHTPAALCAPTRFSMMTGGNPYRNGRPWGTWSLKGSSAFSANGTHDTVGDVMQAAGYRTAFLGKMHFGGDPLDSSGNVTRDYSQIDFSRPIGDGLSVHGFDYSYGLHSGQQNPPYVYYENDLFAPIDPSRPADNSSIVDWAPGTYPNPDGSFSVIQDDDNPYRPGDIDWDSSKVGDQLSRKAVDFIDGHLEQNVADGVSRPFFMYYASQAIHLPHTPPVALDSTAVQGTTINDKTDMLKEFDLQVGRIVAKLETEGLAENTLILVTSDNGALGDGGGELAAGHDSTGGLRGFKGGPYEGGSRVPLIAKWGDGTPAGSFIRPGAVSNQLVMAHDWVATLYDLTRQDMPNDQAEDSTTLLPTLFGHQPEEVPLRSFAVLQSQTGVAKPYMLRMDDDEGEWMIILNGSRQAIELYQLNTDLGQTNDLIDDPDQATRVSTMQQLFRQHDQQNDARSTAPFRAANATPFPDVSVSPPPNPGSISVNLTHSGQSVDIPYGVSESSQWTNSAADNLFNLVDDAGAMTTLDVAVSAPGGRNWYGANYTGTPMHTGPSFYDATDDRTTITLSQIPYDQYQVIVYLSGFLTNPGAQVSDGTTTFYWDSPDPQDPTLVQTTDTDPTDGIDFANYAVFGSEAAPLTDHSLTLSFGLWADGLAGGAGVGGLQIVEIRPLAGDFNGDRVVNGADLFLWQRGGSPVAYSVTDLTAWEAHFGAATAFPGSTPVPEPTLLPLAMLLALQARQPRQRRGGRAAVR